MCENTVKCLIEEITGCKYRGKIHIEKEDGDPTIWTLALYLDLEMTAPVIISYEGTEAQFIEFLKQDIKKRKMEDVSFYRLDKIEPNDNLHECE